MKWVEEVSPEHCISEISYQITDNTCYLSWKWPRDINYVYISRQYLLDDHQEANQPNTSDLKLYTREEYKANVGYRETFGTLGQIVIRIYPCLFVEGELYVLRQEDTNNSVEFSIGKAQIRFSIKYKSSLLSKYKRVFLTISSDIFVKKEVLCYVKKDGEYPRNMDDGDVYPFLNDFMPGKNLLPPIQIKKSEMIKIFISDGKKYGKIYDLIPE